MSSRFFVETPIQGPRAVLTGAEAHHLIHVMRAKTGDRVTLFDGSGDQFEAEVHRLQRAEVELAVLQRVAADCELPVAVTLGVSLPKGDRQKWLVEKAVELGVAALVPLETERSVAQPGAEAIARLGRSVIEASKQCGRNRLMRIEPPQPWEAFLESDADLRWVAHPDRAWEGEEAGDGGAAAGGTAASDTPCRPRSVRLAVGPEGGLTNLEVRQALQAGWERLDLGPRILRIETAAVVLAARVAAMWGQGGSDGQK